MYKKSSNLFSEAKNYIPGGVNSPVRAFKSVDMDPLFIERAEGSRIYDADGNEYIDYVASWGPLILGHAHPAVVEAVNKAALKGTSYGAPTESEIELARLITELYPSIDKVRMVNSGTEATMSAVRLARGFTGREKIIKFDGCYHGHSDAFLIKAGSGALTLGIPGNPGVTKGTASDTLVAQYNHLDSVDEIIGANADAIAAVIVEPVAGNAGVIPPADGFLEGLRKLTKDNGIILIFDEVITGFRVALGGAQERFGITPDLTCLGKIIGGGLPVGAYGGRADIMDMIAPDGPVYQAGTLSGNPLAMAAGLATLTILSAGGRSAPGGKEENPYLRLEGLAAQLSEGIAACPVPLGMAHAIRDGSRRTAKHEGISIQQNRVGSMMCRFFADDPVTDLDTAMKSDTALFTKYFKAMLEEGIYMAPSQFEAGFVSTAHTEEDIKKTIHAHHKALEKIG